MKRKRKHPRPRNQEPRVVPRVLVPVDWPENTFQVQRVTTGNDTSGNSYRFITHNYHPLLSSEEAYELGMYLIRESSNNYDRVEFKKARIHLKYIEAELVDGLEREDDY